MSKVTIKTVAKIVFEQRVEENPTSKPSIERTPSVRMGAIMVNGSLGFRKGTVPEEFTPNKATIKLSNVEFLPKEETVKREHLQYNNDVVAYDVNGVECISDRTLFTNLGITDSAHIRRTSNKLKNLKCKDTGEEMFTENVDYLELDLANSKSFLVANKVLNSKTPLSDNLKPITRWARDSMESAKENEMCFDSPTLVNQNTSDVLAVNTTGSNVTKETVWTIPAAKRIATLSGTHAGNVYHEHLVELEAKYSESNTDFSSALIELQNDKVGNSVPHVPLPKEHKRGEDVIRDMNTPVSHNEDCRNGRLTSKLARGMKVGIVKVNSSKYKNAFVNAYPSHIIDDMVEVYAGEGVYDPQEDALNNVSDEDFLDSYFNKKK